MLGKSGVSSSNGDSIPIKGAKSKEELELFQSRLIKELVTRL